MSFLKFMVSATFGTAVGAIVGAFVGARIAVQVTSNRRNT